MKRSRLTPTPNAMAGAAAAAALTAALTAGGAGAKELEGVRAPTSSPPLSAYAAEKLFKVPEGFEVRLFAAEPMVINPVAMCWDSRGRLWVAELYEYPLGAADGATPRDRIKILEDTDGDEIADKATVFAAGLNLATGLLVGHGGVWVGQAPDLLFLKDTDGDDVADERTVIKTGFGLHDTHELLNGFTWGPDGWLYMTHGVFTHSKVRDPGAPEDDGVIMNAAVARLHPRTHQFEVFADGTSNPWGVDFDADGNAFISACVIDHLFHMAPAGLYVRQGGTPEFGYGYGLLPSIIDHRHFRAAFAGVQVYQGHQYPEPYQGLVAQGNIHGNAVHLDRLERRGSTFRASFVEDFVSTDDGWFRPVSTQTGPDGCLWVMDWYDRYPCYQNAQANPGGVDRAHGRIWRVVHTGATGAPDPAAGYAETPGVRTPSVPCHVDGDLADADVPALLATLSHANNWHRRTARRVLSERRDPDAAGPLANLASDASAPPAARLEALLALHGSGQLTPQHLDTAAADDQENLRTWAARLTGERLDGDAASARRLARLAGDPSAQVRLAVATAVRQHTSGALTVNRPAPAPARDFPAADILAALILASPNPEDETLPFVIWMAAEPIVTEEPALALDWLAAEGAATGRTGQELAYKAMVRICDSGNASHLDLAAAFLAEVAQNHPPLAASAVGGLLDGQKARALKPANIPEGTFEALRAALAGPDHSRRIDQLGALWGDPDAVAGTLTLAADPGASLEARAAALETAAGFSSPDARDRVLSLVTADQPQDVALAALRTLRRIGDDSLGARLVERWSDLPPALQQEAANTLVLRGAWANALVSALEERLISASEIPAAAVRALLNSDSEHLRDRAAKSVGNFRPTPDEIAATIAEKRAVAAAENPPVDLEEGRALATGMCLTCHQLHGTGQDVGPDLTGVGRSSLDALLANIIDPDQIIGLGYELVTAKTKDGRTIAGRLVAENDASVTLALPGGARESVPRDSLESLTTSEQSVMPAGLHNIPDAQFRNLVWFLLNPPEDGREMTPELRAALIGDNPEATGRDRDRDQSSAPPPESSRTDGESVALWNPRWHVHAPDFEGSPAKVPDFRGRHNVLVTHPFDRDQPSSLTRTLNVPADGQTTLTATVTSDHDGGNWLFRATVDGEALAEQLIEHTEHPWTEVDVDLTRFAGRDVTVVLENAANDWHFEFAYWADVSVANSP